MEVAGSTGFHTELCRQREPRELGAGSLRDASSPLVFCGVSPRPLTHWLDSQFCSTDRLPPRTVT